jgi:hypothetical protein
VETRLAHRRGILGGILIRRQPSQQTTLKENPASRRGSPTQRPTPEPGPLRPIVEPLGDGLMLGFPDGFSVLLAPAVALPAALPRPLGALPVVVPMDEPVVPIDGPVVLPVAVELPAVEPVPLCAKASVLVRASAAANPIVANFMMLFLVYFRQGSNGGAPGDVPELMRM